MFSSYRQRALQGFLNNGRSSLLVDLIITFLFVNSSGHWAAIQSARVSLLMWWKLITHAKNMCNFDEVAELMKWYWVLN